MEDGAVRRIGDPALLAENALCEAGLATTVADVWRTARLGAPYPLTVAQAERRGRPGKPRAASGMSPSPIGRGPPCGASPSPSPRGGARGRPGATVAGKPPCGAPW